MANHRLDFATTDQFVGMIRSDPLMELVWENGQVLVRELSGSPSCVSHPPSQKFQAKNDEDMFSAKTRTLDHYSGQKESSKLDGSLQQDHHAGLFPGFHQNDFNLFFESTRNFDGGVESQVVPVCKNASSRNRFEFVAENPHITEASNVPAAKVNQCLVPELQNQDTELMLVHTMSTEFKLLAEPLKQLPHDEQTQSAAYKNTTFQYCPDKVFAPITASSAANRFKEKSRDQLVGTTSMCSRAPNDMACSSRRRIEDKDLTTSPSNNVEEEKTSSYIEAYRAGQRGRCKRNRSTEVHNMSEKKRRAKINKKMRELQELIPNGEKVVDKASMLDQAIEYLKNLQIQVQIMQMARSLCTQSMMLSSGMQQMQAPQLGHLFSSLGMGMHMGGVGCNPSMFIVPSMLGLPGQMLPMPPLSQPPFIPFIGGSSGNAIVAVPHNISGLATPGQLLGSASLLR